MAILTIVIPTYNAEKHIVNCLESIISSLQEELNSGKVVVLIKDGSSTDSSIEIIKSYMKKYTWLYFSSMKDKGVYDAMNQAIDFSQTPWVYFLGADDSLMNSFKDVFTNLNGDVLTKKVHYFNVLMTSNGSIYNNGFNLWKLLRKNICHQGIIYPRELLVTNKYSLKYPILSDWALNICLFKKFCHHNHVIACYNDVTGLSNTFSDNKFIVDKPHLFRNSHGTFWFLLAKAIYFLSVVKRAFNK
ncbi:glycosyltransferase [Photorhabdus akhurstii]|uniref:glycosyltransferase n=1 Tax=Photorhabdus akhurstii TaxID=171438 RepID=UPI003703CAE2